MSAAKTGPMETVLLVDQDAELSSILSAFLLANGLKVQTTTRAGAAIRKLEIQRFHHVFLDPELRNENALEIINTLSRNDSLNSKTPITLMSADGGFQLSMPTAKRIHSILMKPFTLSEFAYHLSTGQKAKTP